MSDENNLTIGQKKPSEWDNAIFVVILMMTIFIPIIFCPYCNPVFSPVKNLVFQCLVLIGSILLALRMIRIGYFYWTKTLLNRAVFLYLLLGLSSVMWSINIYNSLLALPFFLAGPILYFLIINTEFNQDKIDKLLLVIIITGIGMGIYGIFQYSGIDFSFWSGNIARNQVMGFFGNVNYFAEYLILPLSLTIGLILAKNKIYNRLLLFFALVTMGGALFLTFTRSSYLAIVITVPVILFLYCKSSANKQKKIFYKKIILYFVLFAITAFAIIYIPHPLNREDSTLGKLRSRVTIESLTSGSSVLRRVATWKFTWMMIDDYPLLGSGLGTYDYHTLKYQAEFFAKGNNRDIYPHGFAVQAHNEYLQIWSELGIIGLLLFLWIIFNYYRNILIHFRRMGEKEKAITIGLSGGVTAALIDSLFGFPLQLAASIALFWIFLGFTSAQINIANTREKMLISHEKDENNVKTEVLEDKQKNNNSIMATIKKIILYFLVIALMIISILFIFRPFLARVYWYYGEKQIEQGNYNKAIKIYEKGLKWNPWQGEMYYGIGVILYRGEINQLALEYFHKAEKYMDFHYLPQNIANLYIKKGEVENSIPYMEKAIKYQPEKKDMLPLQLQLGNIYLTTKDYKDSERIFADAIENNTDSAEAYYGIAGAYLKQDKKEQGIEALEKVIDLAPESKLAGYAKIMLKKMELEE
jgi:O-antigen ligase/tetratricopeptide (TPR) repeat protein